MKKRINNRFDRNRNLGESDIYRKFTKQFLQLFDVQEILKNNEEFESVYVNDNDFETQIERFRNSITNMTKFCAGYTGIGKTMSIRHCFGLGITNEAYSNISKKELIFPAFYDSYDVTQKTELELAERISAVCSKLEYEYPDLRDIMATVEGKAEFCSFIAKHTPFALENIDPVAAMDMEPDELIRQKLHGAYKDNPYEFQANRLKYYMQ